MKKVLAIESSCDETACAIIDEELNILSSVVTSQIDVHARFGGVIPEIASRMHVEQISIIDVDSVETQSQHFVIIEYQQQWYICTDNGLPSLVFGDEWTSITRIDSGSLQESKNFVAYDLFCKVAMLLASKHPKQHPRCQAPKATHPGAKHPTQHPRLEITSTENGVNAQHKTPTQHRLGAKTPQRKIAHHKNSLHYLHQKIILFHEMKA